MADVPHEPTPNEDLEAFEAFFRGESPAPRSDPEPAPTTDSGPSALPDYPMLALRRALGDVSLTCPHCGIICDTHDWDLKIRDLVFRRGLELGQQWLKGLVLYFQNREFGVETPTELLLSVYNLWEEIGYLGIAAEPQDDEEEECPGCPACGGDSESLEDLEDLEGDDAED
jgi:hypothetical protein